MLDTRELRNVMGSFVTGVTVVTTVDNEGQAYGVTANSFTSVSLEPPLVLWSQSINAKSFQAFRDGDRFVVNILAENQVDISNRFAKSGADKFKDIAVSEGLGGVPIIDGCAAHIECSKVATYPGGDHAVFLGRVERFHHGKRKSLAFGGGKYMVAFAHDLGEMSIDVGMASLAHLEAVRMCTVALPELCEKTGHTVSLGVWGNHGPTVIRWEASPNPVSENLRTGLVLNVTRSAAGLLFAAFLPRALTRELIEHELAEYAQAPASEDMTTPAKYELQLEEVRQRRMSRSAVAHTSVLHKASVTSFSAPVFDATGMIVMSMTVTARADRLDPSWDGAVPRTLAEFAGRLSARLGYKAGG